MQTLRQLRYEAFSTLRASPNAAASAAQVDKRHHPRWAERCGLATTEAKVAVGRLPLCGHDDRHSSFNRTHKTGLCGRLVRIFEGGDRSPLSFSAVKGDSEMSLYRPKELA
jgi:hypothetical protein